MKKQILMSLLLVGSLLSAVVVKAADDSSGNPNPQSTPASKKTGDIDDEITNARLRAVTGAKSPWSFWSVYNYAGAAITDPFSVDRPQLNSQNGTDPTMVFGQVSGKYRMTEHDSLLAGVGIQYVPAYTDAQAGPQAAQATVQSPYIDYNRAFRVGGVQHVLDFSVAKYTASADVSSTGRDLNFGWAIQHQMMIEMGKSGKLSVGLASNINQDIHNSLSAGESLSPATIYMQIQVDPVMEYAFTEKTSFRTVYRMLTVNELYYDRNVWHYGIESESVGIGYALTRDIYLYPNMQWAWASIAASQTTIGFSANVNL